MSKRSLPQPFEIDKIRFNDCFGAPSMRHFSVLITGWVLSVGTHTISQVILAAGVHESEHFATIYSQSNGRENQEKPYAKIAWWILEYSFD